MVTQGQKKNKIGKPEWTASTIMGSDSVNTTHLRRGPKCCLGNQR